MGTFRKQPWDRPRAGISGRAEWEQAWKGKQSARLTIDGLRRGDQRVALAGSIA
jgi:hypothetical protein